MSLSSNLLRLARSLARGVFLRSGVSSPELGRGVTAPALSNSNTPGIPQPSSCPASGGAGQSPLIPLRRPFTISGQVATDGWSGRWYRYESFNVPGLTYWYRVEDEDEDDNRKMEHAVEVDGDAYHVVQASPYRNLCRAELVTLAWRLIRKHRKEFAS